ncbi:DUF362 domain-containing protein [[Eubacterium] cellulosolvens]
MRNLALICSLSDAVTHLHQLSLRAGFTIEKSKLALVKPNICGLYHPSLDLLSSVIEFLLPYTQKVVIGETKSMMHEPNTQFEKLGVTNLVKSFQGDVKAVDLSDDEWIKTKVPNPHALKEIELPRVVLESNSIINIPKVGTHSSTRLTGALKNLFGLLPEKRKYSRYHPLGMDKVTADIAKIVKPDLNIVDTGDQVILGVDPLVVDIVSCKFVKLNPFEVEHIRLVSQDRGLKLEDYIKKIAVIRPRILFKKKKIKEHASGS